MLEFRKAKTDEDFQDIELMASIIWPIAYKEIITVDQIKYMLNKYLSVQAIKENINTEKYIYEIIYFDGIKAGFIGYKLNGEELFLSKLYVLPNFQKMGLGKEAVEYLQGNNLPITLTVNKYNKNAYDFYIHSGFKVIDSVVTDIGKGYVMDDYIMKLEK